MHMGTVSGVTSEYTMLSLISSTGIDSCTTDPSDFTHV